MDDLPPLGVKMTLIKEEMDYSAESWKNPQSGLGELTGKLLILASSSHVASSSSGPHHLASTSIFPPENPEKGADERDLVPGQPPLNCSCPRALAHHLKLASHNLREFLVITSRPMASQEHREAEAQSQDPAPGARFSWLGLTQQLAFPGSSEVLFTSCGGESLLVTFQ